MDKEGRKSNFHEDEFTIDIKNGMRKFGLSIPIGVSYEYEKRCVRSIISCGVFNIYRKVTLLVAACLRCL